MINRILHIKIAVTYVLFVIWCSYMYPKMQYVTSYNGHKEWAGYVLFFWEMTLCAFWCASTGKIKEESLRKALNGAAFEIAIFNLIMLYFRTFNYDIEEFYWTAFFIFVVTVYTFYQIKLKFTGRYDLLKHLLSKLF